MLDCMGASGAVVVLTALAQCHALEDELTKTRFTCRRPRRTSRETLQELDLVECYEIPAEAWQQLGKANWTKLRKANFYRYLGSGIGPKVGAH